MKKILITLIMCISFIACSKDNSEDITPMVTLSFNQQIVSGNSMTRATTNEFLDIIEEQTPNYVNVTLKNLDLNKTYTCKSNETITIPIGNYEISAEMGANSSKYVIAFSGSESVSTIASLYLIDVLSGAYFSAFFKNLIASLLYPDLTIISAT